MYIIKNDYEYELVIKKSKFITKLFNVSNEDDINSILCQLRSMYKDATHCCYAYVVGSFQKCSDDGEPSGTAGLPILEIIKKRQLTNVLVVVIRYFGGIKLGAGGLVRAYSKSVREALDNTELVLYKEYVNVTLTTFYDNQKLLDLIVKDYEVIKKSFVNNIVYIIKLEKKDKDILINKLSHTKIEITD